MSEPQKKPSAKNDQATFESNMSRLFSRAYEPECPTSTFVEQAVDQMVERAKEAASRRMQQSPSFWLPTSGWHAVALAASIALIAASGGVSGFYWATQKSAGSGTAMIAHDAESTVATVVHGVDAEWSHPIEESTKLSAGVLELTRGVAQLEFVKGAVLTLQGPAKLELIDIDSCRLIEGATTANVPPDAIGFSVMTADFEVIDLGTAFGVRVADSKTTEVHVFDGEVDVVGRPESQQKATRLLEGEALLVSSGSPKSIKALPASFVTKDDFSKQLEIRSKRAHLNWKKFSEKWYNDPSVVLRYDFESITNNAILNTANRSRHPATSVNASPRLVNGRWPNKGAMLFDGRTDALVVQDDPELRLKDDLTLAVWMRSNGQPYQGWTRIVGKGVGKLRNFGLWSPANERLVWQICPEGDFEWWDTELATRPLEQGKWHLLVGVLADDMAKIYVNGKLELARAMERPVATSNDPLTIGYYASVPAHEGHFYGEIDELILFNRALAAKEIAAIFTAGKP